MPFPWAGNGPSSTIVLGAGGNHRRTAVSHFRALQGRFHDFGLGLNTFHLGSMTYG